MRIGLNATCFNDRPSGARQRFVGIYGELVRRCPDLEFIVYEPKDCAVARWFGDAPNVIARPTPLPSFGRFPRALAGLAFWRSAFAAERLDLYEAFHLPLVRGPRCPTILTIHDARWASNAVYRKVVGHSIRRADHVVTVSETMREELLGFAPDAAVTAIHNGIDAGAFVRPGDAEKRGTRLDLPRNFLLAVGHLEPRKNYGRLIDALAILRRRGSDLSLVIVGNFGVEGDQTGAIREQVRQLGLEQHVRLLRDVSDSDLVAIYALSALVVFPSCYEGFGIPAIEAMAARRPLVCSDIAVFRELTEGRGAYFPPNDSSAMAEAIAAVLASPERQDQLIEYGDRRVKDFAFPRLAAQVERLYRSLARPARWGSPAPQPELADGPW